MYLHMDEVSDVLFPYLSLRAKNHTVFSLRAAWILDSELSLEELSVDEIRKGKKLRQIITEEQTKIHRLVLPFFSTDGVCFLLWSVQWHVSFVLRRVSLNCMKPEFITLVFCCRLLYIVGL